MKNLPLIAILAILLTTLPAIAYGQDGGARGGSGSSSGPREACRNDAQTFCQGVQPGGGRILDCLKDHSKQISDTCYSALQNMGSRSDSTQNSASPDEGH